MWAKGYQHHGYTPHITISYPPPSVENYNNADGFVTFSFKPRLKQWRRNYSIIFYKLIGTLRAIRYIHRLSNVKFIIMTSTDFLTGVLLLTFCRLKNVELYIEKGDENGKLYSDEKLGLIDRLALYNHILFDHLILPQTNALFVVSSYLLSKYDEMYPDLGTIQSIPTYIDPHEYRSNRQQFQLSTQQLAEYCEKPESIKVLYAGAINRLNGIEFFLLNLSKILNSQQYDVEFIVFALYGSTDALLQIAEKYGVANHLKIFEPVQPKYLPAIYADLADILLLPEQGTIIANAGFPGKVGELLFSGKPVITTDFSDLSKYLSNNSNAMISKLGDAEQYAHNLEYLIKSPEVRERIGKQGMATAEVYFHYAQGVLPYLNKSS